MAENPQINEQEQEAIRLKTLAESNYNSSNLKLALNYANQAHNLYPNLPGLTEMLTAFKILHSSINPRKPPKNLEHPFPSPDLYNILGVTPFSSLSIIKAQYKKLALLLHPDKNTIKNASNEAFKLVNDAFHVFSDKGKRRVYDTRLRLALLEEKEVSEDEDDEGLVEEGMFWTMCSKCRLRHRFERNYVGQRLVCPSCEHNFEASEVGDDDHEEEEDRVESRKTVVEEDVEDWEMSSLSELVGKRIGKKRKMGSVNVVETPIVEERRRSHREKSKRDDRKLGKSGTRKDLEVEKSRIDNRKRSGVVEEEVENSENDLRKLGRNGGVSESESVSCEDSEEVEELTLAEMQMNDVRKVGRDGGVSESESVSGDDSEEVEELTLAEMQMNDVRKLGREGGVSESESLSGEDSEEVEELTLAEMQMNDVRKVRRDEGVSESGSVSGEDSEEVEELTLAEMQMNDVRKLGRDGGVSELESVSGENGEEVEELTLAEMQMKASRKPKGKKEDGKRKVTFRKEVEVEDEDEEEVVLLNKKKRISVESGDLEVMTVEDSDFYDFDEDRVERSFKKGQVWAIYDDDDGMPRHYGLIDEVVSVNPFVVKMSWLDFQNDGNERSMICWEKKGFHVSCGKFKVARKDDVKLLNIFSHLVACERAARELYRIYPRKGSVWALYNERALDMEEGNSPSSTNKRAYDIVLVLTSYSEAYGLSMAYLKKVDGYKAVFTRREIGYNAIRCLEKNDIRLFSHQIPARKLSEDEASQLSGDCWELDPASLPQDLLAVHEFSQDFLCLIAFETNLNNTLYSQLLPKASSTGFWNFTQGSGDDQAYALFYCKGDVDQETCQDCVEAAARKITDACKFSKEGIVWFEECTLRCLKATLRLRDTWANTMVFLPSCVFRYELYEAVLPSAPSRPKNTQPGFLITVPAVVMFVMLAAGGCCWLWQCYSKVVAIAPTSSPRSTSEKEGDSVQGLPKYSFSKVDQMTDGFKKQLGKGGYGVVYHGHLLDGSKEVAVKVLSEDDAPMQFSNEISVFLKISHKNLVSLLGYCKDGTNLALIYEFMDNGDLRTLLSENAGSVSWTDRLNIAIDTAEGLHYLHSHCGVPIIHRDVKPANILLNQRLQAKVADFGLTKIFPEKDVTTLKTRVISTPGYTAPEYSTTGQLNAKADVYSFGVVLLELITGVTPRLDFDLVEWFENVYKAGDIKDILDPRIKQQRMQILDNGCGWKAIEVAKTCVEKYEKKRPTMWEVLVNLKQCLDMVHVTSEVK
ncbi:uncharacterized protein LOC141598743 [Silene latifolia]|uniref:uncharacterized protein LOC141598743 n=1 Tax=Silene latifolia TaxID=37657 RepID=UPI003D7898D0